RALRRSRERHAEEGLRAGAALAPVRSERPEGQGRAVPGPGEAGKRSEHGERPQQGRRRRELVHRAAHPCAAPRTAEIALLRFASLASGSRGNCLVVEAGDGTSLTRVLLDCGLNLTDSERRLARLGLAPRDIDGML